VARATVSNPLWTVTSGQVDTGAKIDHRASLMAFRQFDARFSVMIEETRGNSEMTFVLRPDRVVAVFVKLTQRWPTFG